MFPLLLPRAVRTTRRTPHHGLPAAQTALILTPGADKAKSNTCFKDRCTMTIEKIAMPVSSTVLHKYYPIIKLIPSKFIDIITIGKTSECMVRLAQEGYSVIPASRKIDISPYAMGLYTSEQWEWVDDTKRPKKKLLIDHASLKATQYDFDHEIVICEKFTHNGNKNCNTIYTGLFQFDNDALNLYVNNKKILRDTILKEYGFKDTSLPLVVCFTTIMDDHHELVEPLIEISQHTNLIVKTYAWHTELQEKISKAGVTTFGMRDFRHIDPRLAADCFLTSYSTTALMTAVMLGQNITVYHTTREFDIGRTNTYYERGVFQHPLFPRCRDLEARLGSIPITDVGALLRNFQETMSSQTYKDRLKALQDETYGRYHIVNAPAMTAMEVLSVFRRGRFSGVLGDTDSPAA